MLIHVLREDIKNGTPNTSRFCPVALAMLRQGLKNVRVDDEELSWDSDFSYAPRSVSRFIAAFDAEMHVKPFSFTLKSHKEQ